MGKFKDLTGKVFNKLTVIRRVENDKKHKKVMWECSCSCGNTKIISSNRLQQRGNKISCGCEGRKTQAENAKNNFTKHGDSNTYEYRMWTKAKSRAVEKSLPFDISHTDIEIPKHCPILGIPLYKGDTQEKDNSPSLDRLIPELGYVKGNINVVSNRANTLKRDGTLEEFEKIVAWLKRVH